MAKHPKTICIIGGGPAGLMAAEQVVGAGFDVHIFERMPSMGRKFLMAGKSGLNISHNEDMVQFLSRYGVRETNLRDSVQQFSADDIRHWASGLGVETFVGSSGRIFPKEYKAAPLLRAWIKKLRAQGLQTHMRHDWQGWNESGHMVFHAPDGTVNIKADACILALGGASWPQLGSNAKWLDHIPGDWITHPFEASNCGFNVTWSDFFRDKFAGTPVKSVALSVAGSPLKRGDFVISSYGVEGSVVYSQSALLRESLKSGSTRLTLDLAPDRPFEKILQKLEKPRGRKSLSTHIKGQSGLTPVKIALLREILPKSDFEDMPTLARAIKALALPIDSMRPIAEAISSNGGLGFENLNADLMVISKPALFVAGEMLDWDAPTGGYLLTACFATGRTAGRGAKKWLQTLS